MLKLSVKTRGCRCHVMLFLSAGNGVRHACKCKSRCATTIFNRLDSGLFGNERYSGDSKKIHRTNDFIGRIARMQTNCGY